MQGGSALGHRLGPRTGLAGGRQAAGYSLLRTGTSRESAGCLRRNSRLRGNSREGQGDRRNEQTS